MRQAIELDFAARRRSFSVAGAALLMLGVVAAAAVFVEYRAIGARRAGLELRLEAANRLRKPAPSAADALADARVVQSVQQAAQDLATPWTLLLAELERASSDVHGEIAVLGVEPDHAKHNVRVTAEARTLPQALAYVERLQTSKSLEFTMLDRHEVRADDASHPVRFELTGQWRDMP